MSINITYVSNTSRKIQKIKPVSSVPKIHRNLSNKQGDGSKGKNPNSDFEELFNSKIDSNKSLQKKKWFLIFVCFMCIIYSIFVNYEERKVYN